MPQPKRNAGLRRLDALVGEWELHASFRGQHFATGRTTFAWLEEGAFLVQHTDAEPPPDCPAELVANLPFPTVVVIGLDETTDRFTMLYADARGVSRVSEMSLNDGIWKFWRDAPGFSQRFTGAFSDDGQTITTRGEMSRDGTNWEPDVESIYTKVS